MGLFKKIKKGVSSVTKGIGKAVKSVVKGVVKVGKKIVKGVGKIMGKLGPIGTIAIGFLAPYALGAIAGAGMGWLSTAATKIMEVSSLVSNTIAAPFKALGSTIGSAVSQGGASLGGSLGGSLGQGITTITSKIGSALGGAASGDITAGAKKIFGDLSTQYSSTFSSSVAKSTGTNLLSGLDKGLENFSISQDAAVDFGFQNASPAQFGSLAEETGMALPNVHDVVGSFTPEFKGAGINEGQSLLGVSDTQKFGVGYQGESTSGLMDGLKKLTGALGNLPQPTAPAYMPIVDPGQGDMTPGALTSADGRGAFP